MRRSSRKQAKPIPIKNPPVKERTSSKKKGSPPGRTLESAENQLIGLASDLAKRQMENGTASSQVITHFLKLGSSQNRLETEKLRRENELLQAKTEALKSQKRVEELMVNALQAMRSYTGSTSMPGGPSLIEDDESDD